MSFGPKAAIPPTSGNPAISTLPEIGRGNFAGPPPPPVNKPAGVRPLGPVGIGPLKAMLGRLSENVWQFEDAQKENRYPCFHHTRHIVFRFIDDPLDARRFHSNPGWLIWRDSLLPAMARASAAYGFAEPVYPKAMLARLAAGHGIDRHVDGGGTNLHTHKIHVPLRTDPAAVLTVAGADYHLREAHAYEVNNTLPHGAFNGGTRDRIHFIFEVFDAADFRAPVHPSCDQLY